MKELKKEDISQEVFDLYDVIKNKMEIEEGKLAKLLTTLIDK